MKPQLLCVALVALTLGGAGSTLGAPAKSGATTRPAKPGVATRAAAGSGAAEAPKPWTRFGSPVYPTSTPPGMKSTEFIHDSTVVATVGDRVIRAIDIRERYFGVASTERPAADSLGRIEFLRMLLDKEIVGMIARKLNRPLEFEQRAELRNATSTVLQNTLYQRTVADSLAITEADVAAGMPQFESEVRIRRILFDDRATAESVRRQLQRGTLTWAAAVTKFSQANDSLPDGDLGWFRRSQLQGDAALKVFVLNPGQISEPIQDSQGIHLVQVTERRKSDPPPLRMKRRLLLRDLHEARSTPLVRRMYAQARDEARLVYDSTNVAWVVNQFRPAANRTTAAPGVPLRIQNQAPRFTTEDRDRVLAHIGDKPITLRDFLEEYSHVPAVFRRPIVSADPFYYTFESLFLGDALAELARQRGLDKDPLAVSQIEERFEKLLAERLHADSVEKYVRVNEAMRRAEYESEVKEGRLKIPLTVRFALIIRHTQAGVDSVLADLRAGTPADSIVARDLRRWGKGVSQMHEAKQGDANAYSTILFEELKPGESTFLGPDSENKYLVLHVVERREERTLTYDEALSSIDESARNVEASRLFEAFLARHRPEYPQSVRADLLMRVNMTDPLMD